MDNFDEVISQYATKRIDEQNPQIITYEIKRRNRTETFINGKRNRAGISGSAIKVNTPKGLFDSMKLAAEAYGVTKQTISLWIKKKEEFTEVKDD